MRDLEGLYHTPRLMAGGQHPLHSGGERRAVWQAETTADEYVFAVAQGNGDGAGRIKGVRVPGGQCAQRLQLRVYQGSLYCWHRINANRRAKR